MCSTELKYIFFIVYIPRARQIDKIFGKPISMELTLPSSIPSTYFASGCCFFCNKVPFPFLINAPFSPLMTALFRYEKCPVLTFDKCLFLLGHMPSFLSHKCPFPFLWMPLFTSDMCPCQIWLILWKPIHLNYDKIIILQCYHDMWWLIWFTITLCNFIDCF